MTIKLQPQSAAIEQSGEFLVIPIEVCRMGLSHRFFHYVEDGLESSKVTCSLV